MPGLFKLIAHELGHRYYFRFMSQADRARFGILFGDVPAVSEYGGLNAEEDFAEALSAFALGVPAETDGQQERYDLLDQYAQIADQQLNAEESGLGPLPNTFEICG
mgnify:CR=1 FL=1